MTMIRPETEMKDSGIQWLGNIPKEWSIIKGKYILKQLSRSVLESDNVVTCFRDGEVTLRSNRRELGFTNSLKEIGYQGVEPGDLVVHGMDGFAGAIGISDSRGKMSPIINVLESGECKKYLMYYLRGLAFVNVFLGLSTGIRERSCDLRWNKLANLEYTIPPLSEQQAIADYLDETCSKIDEIIAEAKASIDEYKELKQAVIFDGISLGTRKCCDYKRTTLKGIEKIPIEWEYRKLKFLIRYIESGVSVNAGNEPATELEYGVLKTSCVSKMIFLPSENKSVNKDEYDRVKCPVCGDTIIVSRMNTPDLVGACAYIEKNIDNIFLPDRLWQVHFNDNVNVKYIYYCLISPYIRNYYSSLSTGTSSSMQNISQGQFTNAIIPYPPLEEQKEIVDFLDKRTKEIDSLIAEKQSLIADLEAYKKSLIYEVVTGKRKVV